MPITLEPPKPKEVPRIGGPEPPTDAGARSEDWGGRSGGASERYRLGVWIGLASVVMVFAAFTSAMVVRKGLSNDWRAIEFPALLWFNTLILVCSSGTLEIAKKALRRGRSDTFTNWWTMTTALGIVFLSGQIAVWRQLVAQGVYLAANPANSFFYLLTAAHGLHLLGGVLALGYILLAAKRGRVTVRRREAAEATGIYWHFMDGLWVYLLVLLLVWR